MFIAPVTCAALSSLLISVSAGPPATPVETVVDTYHGTEIVDDYRWLEPLESKSERVRTWTDEQLAYTRSVLDTIPGRERLEARLTELMQLPAVSAPHMAGDRYFYHRPAQS